MQEKVNWKLEDIYITEEEFYNAQKQIQNKFITNL